jgi:SAM-dependent methyltransferase
MSVFKFLLNTIPRPLLIKASYLTRPVISFLLSGKNYTDPIDGKTFRKFLPYGYESQRDNALAPSSLSLERHRFLWLYLNRKTSFFSSTQKVLHIAPEQCFFKRFKKQENLSYLTCDLHSPLADLKADICNLPLESNAFDVVFCNHVLEHIHDDKKAMQELFRVLKPGGFGFFQVPQDLNRQKTYEDAKITSPKERKKHFGQYDHVRIYGQDYFEKLRAIGFEVSEIKCSDIATEEEINKYRLIKNEILPVCKKLV